MLKRHWKKWIVSYSSVNSVEKWDILMNFYDQNDSVLCHVPKGTTLAVLKSLHLVVGIVSLIIKVLGIGAVVQVALKGQRENISLGSFQLLIHLQKKTWPLVTILCRLL